MVTYTCNPRAASRECVAAVKRDAVSKPTQGRSLPSAALEVLQCPHAHTQILIKQKLKEERRIRKLQTFFPGCWRKKKFLKKIRFSTE